MPFPLARQGFIVESLDGPQPRRSRKRGNVLPLFVALQNLKRHRTGQLLLYPAMLFNSPHTIRYLYHNWYVNAPATASRSRSPSNRSSTQDFPLRDGASQNSWERILNRHKDVATGPRRNRNSGASRDRVTRAASSCAEQQRPLFSAPESRRCTGRSDDFTSSRTSATVDSRHRHERHRLTHPLKLGEHLQQRLEHVDPTHDLRRQLAEVRATASDVNAAPTSMSNCRVRLQRGVPARRGPQVPAAVTPRASRRSQTLRACDCKPRVRQGPCAAPAPRRARHRARAGCRDRAPRNRPVCLARGCP